MMGKDCLASFLSMEMLASCETSEQPFKMIVIEDGGFMLLNDSALREQSIPSFRKENSAAEDKDTDSKLASFSDMGDLVEKHLGGTVEHTRNGYDKVQKAFLKHGKLARPCFTIAISYVKTHFEALSVADTCINSLTNALFSHSRTIRAREVKTLVSVADWKPANFMFYGVPTEDIDIILAQLVDISVGLVNKLDAPNKVHAVDYDRLATNGIIEAKFDPLKEEVVVPSPPIPKSRTRP